MATLYWVDGTGNTNDINHYSLTSGGSGGAALPTSADSIRFDANSFATTGQTVTVNADLNCLDMDWTGATNNPTFTNSGGSLTIYGSLTFISGMTFTQVYAVNFRATSTGKTITTAGKTFGYNVNFLGVGGGWSLQDDLNLGNNVLDIQQGSFNSNGKNITAQRIMSSYSNTRTVNISNSTITLSGSSMSPWYFLTTTNLTLITTNSKIVYTGSNSTFVGGGKTYHIVDLSGVGTGATISGSNTMYALVLGAGKTYTFYSGQTHTVKYLWGEGTSGNLITILSSNSGTAYTINKTSGSLTLNYYSIIDCTFSGGATCTAYNSTNVSGNTGITFSGGSPTTGKFWVADTGNISDNTNHWASISGGKPGTVLPDSTTSVRFDENSFQSASSVVTINATLNCLDMDWSGATNNPTMSGSSTIQIYGSLTFIQNMTCTHTGQVYFKSTDTGKTITLAGKSLQDVWFYGDGGEWAFQDDFAVTYFQLLQGTVNFNDKAITFSNLTIDYTMVKTLNMGASLVIDSGNWNIVNATNLTINAGTSTIRMSGASKTFTGKGLTYYNLELTGTPITISGSNTFNDLKGTAGKTINFTAGTTQTVTTYTGIGALGNVITMQSTLAGSTWTISKASGTVTVDYCSIKDSTATGGATWDATNSTNVSGNTGWSFVALGVCNIAASATVSVTDFTPVIGAAAISVSATVASSAVKVFIGSASPTASATLSATAVKVNFAISSVSASATVSITPLKLLFGTDNISASGTVSASALKVYIVTASINSSGDVSCTALKIGGTSASISATGSTVTVAAAILCSGSAILTSGSVVAVSSGTHIGVVNINSTGFITVTALLIKFAESGISSATNISAAAKGIFAGVTSISSFADMSCGAVQVYFGATEISSSGAISPTGMAVMGGVSSITSSSDVSVTCVKILLPSVSIVGSAMISATANYILYGVFSGSSEATIIVIPLKILKSGLANSKMEFFAFNSNLYGKNGTDHIQYDGITASDVVGYVPTLTLGRSPSGGGTVYEAFNLLSPGFIDSFNGDGTSTSYQLSLTGLDPTLLVASTDGGINYNKIESTDFTVDRTIGKVNWVISPAAGTNNAKIKAFKTVSGYADRIKNCKAVTTFGGTNDTKVFVAYNENLKSYYFMSATNDATYFPDNKYNRLGSDAEQMIGFAKMHSTLIIFKEKSTYSAAYNESDGTFPTIQLHPTIGCDMPYSIQLIDNRPIFANTYAGVHLIEETLIRDERNARLISGNINGSRFRTGLLDETLTALKVASSVDYDGKYWLNVGNKAWVWDYRLSPWSGNDEVLAWFYRGNINAKAWLGVDRSIYYGDRTTGRLSTFIPEYNDFGEAINGVFRSKLWDFNLPDFLKAIKEVIFVTRGNNNSSINIRYFDENGEYVDETPVLPQDVNSFDWDNWDWDAFTWEVTEFPRTIKRKPNIRNVVYFQLELSNNGVDQNLSLLNLIIGYSPTKKVRVS